jgi:hypothetical protein
LVHLDQTKRAKGRGVIEPPIPQEAEDREPVLFYHDCLAVTQAGRSRQAADGVDDQGIAVGEVIAVAGISRTLAPAVLGRLGTRSDFQTARVAKASN